jgi:hypothetical protein
MIPLLGWWNTWHRSVRRAKEFPETQGLYCRAAAIAQMNYLCYFAQLKAGKVIS